MQMLVQIQSEALPKMKDVKFNKETHSIIIEGTLFHFHQYQFDIIGGKEEIVVKNMKPKPFCRNDVIGDIINPLY